MSVSSEGAGPLDTLAFANDIATAPGDLPMPDIAARFFARLRQFRHDNAIEPLAPGPHASVAVTATTGTEMHLDQAVLFYTRDGSQPGVDSQSIRMDAAHVDWDPQAGYLTTWRAEVPGLPAGTVVRYRIGGWRAGVAAKPEQPDVWAHDGQGFWFKFPGESGITTFAYVVEEPKPPMPAWMDDAVIYHIFLDRFHPGTPDGRWSGETGLRTRHGGNLKGVREALPYLQKLGVTCLWLSPLHPAETYHRYDGIDFFEVDSDLGTLADMKDLVNHAHRVGMRIWLDFVPSHCSWRHPAFEMAQANREAPTSTWFTFNDWPNDYRSFLQVAKYLPSFDTQDAGARQYLIDAAVFWLTEIGVDGFRLDHAIAPSFDFWVAFRVATEAAKSDVVNAGEATDTPDCLRRYRGHLNGILDFPLARALRLSFGTGVWSLSTLDHFLGSYERFMADGPGRVSFLDNHDMDRFLWVAGNDVARLKMAALCQFSLSATPVVYYGTEIGMSQEAGASDPGSGGDAQARRDMQWDVAHWNDDLLDFYQRLIRLRRELPGLSRGRRTTVHLDEMAGSYGYLRTASMDGSVSPGDVLLLFNTGPEERTVALPAGEWGMLLKTNDASKCQEGMARLVPMSGMVLEAQ